MRIVVPVSERLVSLYLTVAVDSLPGWSSRFLSLIVAGNDVVPLRIESAELVSGLARLVQ